MDQIKGEKTEQRLAFKQLSREEEGAVRNAGHIKRLEDGARLDAEGADLLLVLEGALRLMHAASGKSLQMARLRPGEWERAQDDGKAALLARGPSSVLLIPKAEALPMALQCKIWDGMRVALEKRSHHWAERAVDLHAKTDYLSAYVKRMRLQAHEESLHSDIVQSVLRRVPRLPAYVTEILNLLQDPDVSAEAVVECARQDPSLVTELLRTVNSAFFGFDKEVTDVHHAVMLLGFNRVAQIVIGMGVAQTMPNTDDFKETLNHSIATAHMAYEIAKLARVERPAMMSTVALLGDVGKSLLMLLKASFEKMDVFFEFFDPPRIGALLLRHWNLPETIWQGVECQRMPEFAPPGDIPENVCQTVLVVYLARQCDAYLKGAEEEEFAAGFCSDHIRFLKLPEPTIPGIVNKHIVRTLRKQEGKRVFSA